MSYTDNIKTYIKWRGDLSINVSVFNEVDALILSELSYIPFDKMCSKVKSSEGIKLRSIREKVSDKEIQNIINTHNNLIANALEVFEVVAYTERYSNMKICNYINKLDYKTDEQFAAMHVEVSDTFTYIVFRGTTDELVGWKEDFNMSYMIPVPAQRSAVEYINNTIQLSDLNDLSNDRKSTKVYQVGGHSKGGNLAIYGSVYCDKKVQDAIKIIYSFDGPGFNNKMIESDEYKNIKSRIVSYVPESSVVGMLFEHMDKYKVVKSEQTGLKQHDILSWKVKCNRIDTTGDRDRKSYMTDAALSSWISKLTRNQREQFIDVLFSVLDQAGIKSVSDIKDLNLVKMSNIIKVMSSVSVENKEMMNKVVSLLIKEVEENIKREHKSKFKFIEQ